MSTPPPASPPALPLKVSVFDGLDWDAPPVPVRMPAKASDIVEPPRRTCTSRNRSPFP